MTGKVANSREKTLALAMISEYINNTNTWVWLVDHALSRPRCAMRRNESIQFASVFRGSEFQRYARCMHFGGRNSMISVEDSALFYGGLKGDGRKKQAATYVDNVQPKKNGKREELAT